MNLPFVLAQSGGGSSIIVQLLPLVIIFLIFYFLLIRPEQKKRQKHEEYLNNLQKGDKVVTNGGLFGTITKVDQSTVKLDVGKNTNVRVARNQIQGPQSDELEDDDE